LDVPHIESGLLFVLTVRGFVGEPFVRNTKEHVLDGLASDFFFRLSLGVLGP